jgi:hypothetical protein
VSSCFVTTDDAEAEGMVQTGIQERLPEWQKFRERLDDPIGPAAQMTLMEYLYAESYKKEVLNEADASLEANLRLHKST